MSLVSELVLTARTYVAGAYPTFLYHGRRLNGHVPAFCYHDIAGAELEAHLRFLVENDYATLNGDELVTRLSAAGASSMKSDVHEVALTFDDGLAGFYSAVYPLLKKYSMKAVVYVVPAWIGHPGFLTWDQCHEMFDSGLVDVQSHSYSHATVVTALRVVRVWRRSERSPIPWGVPAFNPGADHERISCLPVLKGASLFSARPTLRLPDEFWEACTRLETHAADGHLEGLYETLLNRYKNSTSRVDDTTLLAWMTDDLRRSREEIERAIPGHSVRHLAFPWHSNSSMAWQAAEAAGFVSAAIGLEPTDQSRGRYGRLTRILRVNADFLPCLPGRCRSGFLKVLATKAWRRAQRQHVYGIAH